MAVCLRWGAKKVIGYMLKVIWLCVYVGVRKCYRLNVIGYMAACLRWGAKML